MKASDRIRQAFALVSSAASVAPLLALAACDFEETVSPAPTVDPSACAPTSFVPVPADTCGSFLRLPCGLPEGVKPISGPGCYFSIPDCNRICKEIYFSCHATEEHCTDEGLLAPGEGGAVDVDCVACIGNAGRRFEGLARPTIVEGADPLGRSLARVAWLEAASVRAFARLAAELGALGAPEELRARIARARRDEARHARLAASAAAARGARVPRVVERPRRARSREAVARENAVEGCVGEALAALLLAWDRARIQPEDVRRLFVAVADDELEHAALSLDLQAWLVSTLDPAARARVAARGLRARRRALGSPAVARLPRATRALLRASLIAATDPLFCSSHAADERS